MFDSNDMLIDEISSLKQLIYKMRSDLKEAIELRTQEITDVKAQCSMIKTAYFDVIKQQKDMKEWFYNRLDGVAQKNVLLDKIFKIIDDHYDELRDEEDYD